MRRLKPVNTGSLKHVSEMLKNAEKNPRLVARSFPMVKLKYVNR